MSAVPSIVPHGSLIGTGSLRGDMGLVACSPCSWPVPGDVDHLSIGATDEESSDAPWLVGNGVHDLIAAQQNFEILDFELSDEQMRTITGLDRGEEGRRGPNPDEMDVIPD